MTTKPRSSQTAAGQSRRRGSTENSLDRVMGLGRQQGHLNSLSSQSVACLQNLQRLRLYVGYRVDVEIEQMHA